MKRSIVIKGLFASLLLVVSLNVSAQGPPGGGGEPPHLEFIGNLHQLRLGQVEAPSDEVRPKNYGGNPICLTKGEDLKVTWVDDEPGVQWKVIKAELISVVDATVHWTLPAHSAFMDLGFEYDLPGDMPEYVDKCVLNIEIITFTGVQGEGEGGGESGPQVVGSGEVFVVLATPVAPMAPAVWTTVLDFTCYVAHGSTTTDQVSEKCTQGLWQNGTYKPGGRPVPPGSPPIYFWWTTDNCSPPETFYLKKFIDSDCWG